MMLTRLSFLTYNLWNTMRWSKREKALRAFFSTFKPDVFCLQELRPETRNALDDCLPGHRRVEDGFPGWEIESNIYWNDSLLEEVEHGAEDIGIYSDEYRRLFWVRLRVRQTGETLLVSTAHYTHQEHPDELRTGHSPRLDQAQRTAEALSRLVREGEPGFIMGDLNDPIVPALVLSQAGYQNCFAALGLLPPPTWPSLPTVEPSSLNPGTSETIDWILANDRARPIAATVPHFCFEGASPSDHWPVQAVYELNP